MSVLESSGPEGTVFLALILVIFAVLLLRFIQSTVQKIDARVVPLVTFFAVILLFIVIDRAGDDESSSVENGLGIEDVEAFP